MKATWKHMLEAARAEAALGVDLYNRTIHERSLEGFYVHMHIAWLYLFHARFERDGVDYRYWESDSRLKRIDGEVATWDLKRCLKEVWSDSENPVRANLEASIRIRNRIEHRYARELAEVVAGFSQALVVNFESTLVDWFGEEYSLGQVLRFPVFLQSITASELLEHDSPLGGLPKRLADFVTSELDATEGLLGDPRYEFRVVLVPQAGPKTKADAAIKFVRLDDIDAEELDELSDVLERVTGIVVPKRVPVANKDLLKPAEVADRVEAQIPYRFSVYSHFHRAWKHLGIRPAGDSESPDRTDPRYCVYDHPNDSYLYTEAFVRKLVRETSDPEKFRILTGLEPEPRATPLDR